MSEFKFRCISDSSKFKKHIKTVIQKDLIRNAVDDKLIHPDTNLPPHMYIHMVQKSDLWLDRRSKADGTASSLGKLFIHPCEKYPTVSQTLSAWCDKICEQPFIKTHTVRGHMNWGVANEDVAAVHFALERKLCVTQVGCICLPGTDIKNLYSKYIQKNKDCRQLMGNIDLTEGLNWNRHLLISPDGVVGKPEPETRKGASTICTNHSRQLLGMLEIKCVSPFHHIESEDGYLTWTDEMANRHWSLVGDIPLVYLNQMGLQAMAGIQYYTDQMTDASKMWFIRWSPGRLDTFTFRFRHLLRLSLPLTIMYFHILDKMEQDTKNSKTCIKIATEFVDIMNITRNNYNLALNELDLKEAGLQLCSLFDDEKPETYISDMIDRDIPGLNLDKFPKYIHFTLKEVEKFTRLYRLAMSGYQKLVENHHYKMTSIKDYLHFDQYKGETTDTKFYIPEDISHDSLLVEF